MRAVLVGMVCVFAVGCGRSPSTFAVPKPPSVKLDDPKPPPKGDAPTIPAAKRTPEPAPVLDLESFEKMAKWVAWELNASRPAPNENPIIVQEKQKEYLAKVDRELAGKRIDWVVVPGGVGLVDDGGAICSVPPLRIEYAGNGPKRTYTFLLHRNFLRTAPSEFYFRDKSWARTWKIGEKVRLVGIIHEVTPGQASKDGTDIRRFWTVPSAEFAEFDFHICFREADIVPLKGK